MPSSLKTKLQELPKVANEWQSFVISAAIICTGIWAVVTQWSDARNDSRERAEAIKHHDIEIYGKDGHGEGGILDKLSEMRDAITRLTAGQSSEYQARTDADIAAAKLVDELRKRLDRFESATTNPK